MKVDECSAMGCNAGSEIGMRDVSDHRKIFHFIRTTEDGSLRSDNGVNLSFCTAHAEHFLREWAGLMTGTDDTDRRIYAITALTDEQHRALLSRGISSAIDAYLT